MNSIQIVIIRILIILTGVITVMSCNRDNPAFNRENIKAVWLETQWDGENIPTDNTSVYEFASGTMTISRGINIGSDNISWGASSLYYSVYCCDLEIDGSVEGFFGSPATVRIKQTYDFVIHKDSLMTLRITSNMIEGSEVIPEYETISFRKLNKKLKLADTLYGIWELKSANGISDNSYRIEFSENGVDYEFYIKVGDDWEKQDSNQGTYKIYADFITLTQYDNPYLGLSGKITVSNWIIDSATQPEGGEGELVLSKVTDSGVETRTFKLIK